VIRNISDTARWAGVFRARENDRPDALFRDPFARRLGRVSAVNWLFIGASNEFGEFESGLTASWWGAVKAVVIGGVASMVVTASAAGLFPQLRKADALTAESLMAAGRELSVAEPAD